MSIERPGRPGLHSAGQTAVQAGRTGCSGYQGECNQEQMVLQLKQQLRIRKGAPASPSITCK
ncbi:hypothetical protein LJK88_23135 [Paenibacillus sp. P26]|nr:hypothetical protein LJK88_23135 [Paenibacillus sp. P26]